MGKPDYPTAADLAAVLTGGGITVTAGLSALLTDAAAAGRQAFENATGRVMLAPVGDVTKEFAPPEPHYGLVDIPDLIAVTSVVYQPENATPETLVDGRDYWLTPANAPDDGKPWTTLQMRRAWVLPTLHSNLRAVKVTGRWGYGAEIPEDAWLAMCFLGLAAHGVIIGHSFTGGVKSRKEADRAEEYGMAATEMVKGWLMGAQATVDRYRRVAI